MKTWTMPRISVDTFVPNDFVAGCSQAEETYVKIWAPVKEDNGIEGWQQYTAPAGSHLDSNGRAEDGVLKVYLGEWHIVKSADLSTDDTNTYWWVTAGPKGAVNEEGTISYPPNSVFYKNYSGIGEGIIELVEKNIS